jgi:hypothetical protein
MLQQRFLILALSVIGFGNILTGCDIASRIGIGTSPIGKVAQNPTDYKEATIRGKVTNQFSALGKGAYELKDDTGSMYVWTNKGMPTMNSSITVRGTMQEGFVFAGQNFAVSLIEVERLE